MGVDAYRGLGPVSSELPDVSVRVLGACEVLVDGEPIDLGGKLQRAVLAILGHRYPSPVSVGEILDAVWGPESGNRDVSNVHVYVSNLRKALRRTDSQVGIATTAGGYALVAPPPAVDRVVFEEFVASGFSHAQNGDHDRCIECMAKAEAIWRVGADADGGLGRLARRSDSYLAALRERAHESMLESLILGGRASEALPELQKRVEEEPLNENNWRLLVLALGSVGRRDEALQTYRRAYSRLVDETGLSPSPLLQDAEMAVLNAGVGAEERLLRIGPDGTVAILPLDGVTSMVLGRAGSGVAAVPDVKVSRRHAELRREQGGWVLEDLGSANGTRVNGELLVRPRKLNPGDVAVLGSYRFLLSIPADDGGSSADVGSSELTEL